MNEKSCRREERQTLPEREENDGFDGQELADRIVGGEHVLSGLVEENKSIQGKGDTEVVDHGDIKVSTMRTPITITIFTESFKDKCDDRHERFHSTELESSLFAKPKESNRVCFTRKTTCSIVPRTTDRSSSDLRHYVPFSSQILVTKGKEVVDDER